MTRALLLSSLLFAFIGIIAFIACQTGSETPNAYFGRDGGPGTLGEICRSNVCNDATAVCVDQDGDGGVAPTCRLACDTSANPDPCAAGFLCEAISGSSANEGACVPFTGGEGEGEGEGEGGQ